MNGEGYEFVLDGFRRLHELNRRGLNDSEEADAIRDLIDQPWHRLAPEDQQCIRGISADLHSISESKDRGVKPLNPQASEGIAKSVEARRQGDWDESLRLLRRWSAYFAPADLSFERGQTLLASGDAQTAALFFEHAAQLDLNTVELWALLFHSLAVFDRARALESANRLLEDPTSVPAGALVYAADQVFASSLESSGHESQDGIMRAIAILEDARQRLSAEPCVGTNRSSLKLAWTLLGLCHQALSQTEQAVACFTQAIELDPQDFDLRVARGLASYHCFAPESGLEDLRAAVDGRYPFLWPSYAIAHHEYLEGHFEQSVAWARRALGLMGTDRDKSRVYVLLGAALANSHGLTESVRRVFAEAIRLDPANELAKANLSLYEATADSADHLDYKVDADQAIRGLRLLSHAFRSAEPTGLLAA